MNLKTMIPVIMTLALITACEMKKDADHTSHHDSAPSPQADTIKKSIPKEEHAQVGSAHFTIKYHAPAVRGRTIWGGLVPLGEVWVTGAHSATALEFDTSIIVDGHEIPAGKYALFTIPDKESWTIIINKNWDQHLADEYDQKDDVVRVKVSPEQLEQNQERLNYAVVSENNSDGMIRISWEKVSVSLPFSVKQ